MKSTSVSLKQREKTTLGPKQGITIVFKLQTKD